MDGEGIKELMGEDEGSFVGFCVKQSDVIYGKGAVCSLLGTKRMSSHHVMGSPAYLLILLWPIGTS